MRLSLTGRHVDSTPAIQKLVDRKLVKLDRMFGDALVFVEVVLTQEKRGRVVEIVAHTRGDHMLHGGATEISWQQALATSLEKVVHQGTKIKGKWRGRKRRDQSVKTAAAARTAGTAWTDSRRSRGARTVE